MFGETTYIGPAIALGLCLLLALSARQKRRIVQRDCARVELLLPRLEIGDGRCEIVIWQGVCTSFIEKKKKESVVWPCAMRWRLHMRACDVSVFFFLQSWGLVTNLAALRSLVACTP